MDAAVPAGQYLYLRHAMGALRIATYFLGTSRRIALSHQRKASLNVIAGSIDRDRFFMRSALLLIVFFAALLASPRGFGAEVATSVCEIRAIRSQEVLVGASLENWEPVDDRTVLIWTGHETRAHLVRLERPLSGLTAAPIIDLVDGDGDRSISPCGHDGIKIGGGQEHGTESRIVSIEYLSYRRTMELDRDGQAASLRLMPI